MQPIHRVQGIALWEMLLVLGVLGILAAAVVPGFSASRREAVLTAVANQLIGSVHFARSASILRDVPSVICLSADGARCVSSPQQPARGWLVFHDLEPSSPPQVDGADKVLRHVDLPSEVWVHASRAALTFWPTSRSGTPGTFTFCTPRSPGPQRTVVVSQTGRPRVASRTQAGCES